MHACFFLAVTNTGLETDLFHENFSEQHCSNSFASRTSHCHKLGVHCLKYKTFEVDFQGTTDSRNIKLRLASST